MEVIPSIIYHYLSVISYLGFHHSLRSYHFQSYVYMRVYTSAYLNYKFGFTIFVFLAKQNLCYFYVKPGQPNLSSTAASLWYFNPDIPKVLAYKH